MTAIDLDRPVSFHHLRFLDEGDEVTVGRPDVDSYCVLHADGAALLRQLSAGASPRKAATWYERTYGEPVDVAEFLTTMDELGFLAAEGTVVTDPAPVRWQRLGRAVFSPAGLTVLGLLIAAAVVAMIADPRLAPHYRNLFFTPYMSVLELVLFLGQLPLLAVHELFHTLAGRRLGLRSRLGVGRRLYYVVFETTMDGLVSVPRRQRYLPMLAGMLADVVVLAVLTLIAAATRHPDGSLPMAGGVCLALAFGTLLRLIWQFYFYLQTDLYYIVVTVLGCVDLQATARGMIANRVNRILGRRHRVLDETGWHPTDRAVARWYAWLMVLGYTALIGTLLIAVLPTAFRVLGVVFGRLTGDDGSMAGLADSVLFLAVNLAQLTMIGVLAVRDRRRRHAIPQ